MSTAHEAERFIEQVGFASCMTDSRRPGPSLYIAVCGRRDAVMPRNVQKDEEASAAWLLKDEIIRRGNVYYAKLARGKATFIAPRMIPFFNAIWGMRRADEKSRLSANARKILKVLRREWEMATSDLKTDSGVTDRKAFYSALDELQAAMLVIPEGVVLRAEVHLHLDARDLALSRRADRTRQAGCRRQGDRALFSQPRGPDDSRRARAGHRALASGGWTRQSRAGERRLRDDAGAGLVPTHPMRARSIPSDAFAPVKKIGLSMPDVEAAIKYDGSPVLKAGGVFMAGIATDESAEADSLVVRCEFDDRELMLEDAPETYYVTDYYRRYPVVLVRLSEVSEDALRDLLSVSRKMALEKSRHQSRH